MNKIVKISLSIFAIVIIFTVIFFSISSANNIPTLAGLTEKPHATLTLKISDQETNRYVDDVTVLIDGTVVGNTVQNGEIDITNLEYGRHRISVLVPYYEQCKVEQYVDVEGDKVVPLSIDMPNPVFHASVKPKADLELFNEYGTVSIDVSNTGNLASKNTVAIVFVYLEDNIATPVGTHIIDFGNIASGAQSVNKQITHLDEFEWLKNERIAVIIVDGWKYTPQNDQVICQVDVPAALSGQIVTQAFTYLSQHPELVGTIVKIIIA